MAHKGYSRNTFFGRVEHYDSHGKKTGESRRGMLTDEWIHYDEKGKRIGVTRNSIMGGTYTTDNHGRRLGYSRDNIWGGTNFYDKDHRLVGRSRDNMFGGSTDSEGFANQTSTRPAEWRERLYATNDEEDDIDENEEIEQEKMTTNNSCLGYSLLVIFVFVVVAIIYNTLMK